MSWATIEKTRLQIEARKRELDKEIAERQAEIHNLNIEWNKTCDEADQILAASCALLRRQAI